MRARSISTTQALLSETGNEQRRVGDKLYKYYSEQRAELIDHLILAKHLSQDDAIHAAQRLLDRIIFMAFCEDRHLLPERLIRNTFQNIPPLARATNPRWRAFLDAFYAIDKGHKDLDLPTGFNGELFKPDPIIDTLDLEDRWTEIFHQIGEYDFREEGEINVDVLGHLFEKSITELEKLRVVGLFGTQSADGSAAMPKSAERKRFGIYYTPPAFTQLIIDQTLGALIEARVDPLPDPAAKVEALRKLKVCDPACGSGAFLIAAYDRFDTAYDDAARLLEIAGQPLQAAELRRIYPDYILADNLYGVDLSAESVEITKLALWIRSARRGRSLLNLSQNIWQGNSLVHDPAIHPAAFDWRERFADIFARATTGGEGGFDCVVGNPPWERIKLQKREFFSVIPEVISETNPAKARTLIDGFEDKRPELHKRWIDAIEVAAKTSQYFRESGRFPLTAVGDTNYANVFAETARQIVAPQGRVGMLVPSGIATDNTTKAFFSDLMASHTLIALYDFENKRPWFDDVHRSFKFSVLLIGGSATRSESVDFVFFAHAIDDLRVPARHIPLSEKDLKLLNPNTRTCPIFRSLRDAALAKRLYRNVPVLVDRSRRSGGNAWGFSPWTMFHQSADASNFKSGEELNVEGLNLVGARWVGGDRVFLPLYEAKMVQAYDHRAASVRTEKGNWLRHGQTEETSLVEHQNPEFVALPRWWVDQATVIAESVRGTSGRCFIGFKDISSATNQRTMIAAVIPWSAVTHHFPLVELETPVRRQMCFLSNLNSLIYDYLARQKLGGTTFGFYHLEQIATLPPDTYDQPCPWSPGQTLEDWVAERVLKLTCTAEDMIPLAEAAGFAGDDGSHVHKWKDPERAQLRAELDAAYFKLYGLAWEDVDYILTTFAGIRDEDGNAIDGQGETRRLILEAWTAIAG